MKKILSITIIVFLMILSAACGNVFSRESNIEVEAVSPVATATTIPVPTDTPTPEPESEPGYVKTAVLPVPGTVLNRGDEVSVISLQGDYYEIEYEGQKYYVLSSLIKLNSAEKIEKHTVYAKSKAKLYDNPQFSGEPLRELEQNFELTLIDILNNIAFVKCEEEYGFIITDSISETKIVYNDWGYYGGGGGGNAGGGGGGGAPAGGSDGGDIALGYRYTSGNAVIVLLDDAETVITEIGEQGTAFADNTPAYTAILRYKDKVKITKYSENESSILFNDKIVEVPYISLKLDSDNSFAQWEGFASKKTTLSKDFSLSEKTADLNINDKLSVLEEFDEVYLVQFNETIGYVLKECVSDTETVIANYGWYGDGGGGGGSAPAAEWTEPVM